MAAFALVLPFAFACACTSFAETSTTREHAVDKSPKNIGSTLATIQPIHTASSDRQLVNHQLAHIHIIGFCGVVQGSEAEGVYL